jgi:hypothetical protein
LSRTKRAATIAAAPKMTAATSGDTSHETSSLHEWLLATILPT